MFNTEKEKERPKEPKASRDLPTFPKWNRRLNRSDIKFL